MPDQNFYVYILTNDNNHVMYIGVTNDLKRRITEHQLGIFPDSQRSIMCTDWFTMNTTTISDRQSYVRNS